MIGFGSLSGSRPLRRATNALERKKMLWDIEDRFQCFYHDEMNSLAGYFCLGLSPLDCGLSERRKARYRGLMDASGIEHDFRPEGALVFD